MSLFFCRNIFQDFDNLTGGFGYGHRRRIYLFQGVGNFWGMNYTPRLLLNTGARFSTKALSLSWGWSIVPVEAISSVA